MIGSERVFVPSARPSCPQSPALPDSLTFNFRNGTNQRRWDSFGRLWEPAFGAFPAVHIAGNHEIEYLQISTDVNVTGGYAYPDNYPFQARVARGCLRAPCTLFLTGPPVLPDIEITHRRRPPPPAADLRAPLPAGHPPALPPRQHRLVPLLGAVRRPSPRAGDEQLCAVP